MSLTIPAGLEIAIPLVVWGVVSLQRFKRGMTDTWRQEAEAQKVRADRLDAQVAALTEEIKALRRENAELRGLLANQN
ncbi:hypothetical protein ACIP5N_27700 [Streptomyces sp. NPDC088768]|uniref:hypothetical protein n=1 Tax=Streptomyces sp. NPDC088768 TaxID=3365894 RepID=UPI003816B7FD